MWSLFKKFENKCKNKHKVQIKLSKIQTCTTDLTQGEFWQFTLKWLSGVRAQDKNRIKTENIVTVLKLYPLESTTSAKEFVYQWKVMNNTLLGTKLWIYRETNSKRLGWSKTTFIGHHLANSSGYDALRNHCWDLRACGLWTKSNGTVVKYSTREGKCN